MQFEDIATLVSIFQQLGVISMRIDKYSGKLELVNTKYWIWLNQFGIVLCFVRLGYLVNILCQLLIGQIDIPTADTIYITQQTIWFAIGTFIQITFFGIRAQIAHFFNVFLFLQKEVQDKWEGEFDRVWCSTERLIKYAMQSVVAGSGIVFYGMIVDTGKHIHTSFAFGPSPSFLSKVLLACFDLHTRFMQIGVSVLIFYVMLIYIVVTRKGLHLLRNEGLSENSILLFRKYELVNKIFNEYYASTFTPVIIGALGSTWIYQLNITIGMFDAIGYGFYIECVTGLCINTIFIALFLVSAASIHKSTVVILDGWNVSSPIINVEFGNCKNNDQVSLSPDKIPERAGNLELEPIILDNKACPNIESQNVLDLDGEAILLTDCPINAKTNLQLIVKSLNKFGIQVAAFSILKKSTVTSFYQFVTDIAINILLNTK